MRVLICGSRDWKDEEAIRHQLLRLKEEHGLRLLVITGFARGADQIAAKLATELGIDTVAYPANWKGRGKSAGPVRNTIMLRHGRPELVIAFHNFLPNSKGTKNMIEQAEKASIGTMVVKETLRDRSSHAAA
jgi:hypothetical protein